MCSGPAAGSSSSSTFARTTRASRRQHRMRPVNRFRLLRLQPPDARHDPLDRLRSDRARADGAAEGATVRRPHSHRHRDGASRLDPKATRLAARSCTTNRAAGSVAGDDASAVNGYPLSVGIVTRNRRKHMLAAIRMVLPQLEPGDELVVVDNGSLDGTADAARKSSIARQLPRTSSQRSVYRWRATARLLRRATRSSAFSTTMPAMA